MKKIILIGVLMALLVLSGCKESTEESTDYWQGYKYGNDMCIEDQKDLKDCEIRAFDRSELLSLIEDECYIIFTDGEAPKEMREGQFFNMEYGPINSWNLDNDDVGGYDSEGYPLNEYWIICDKVIWE